jgi:hypothetical protein
VQLVDEVLDMLFLLWRTMQLEQHVPHWEVVVDFAAIIVIVCFVVSVAFQRDEVRLIDTVGDAGTRMPSRIHRLRVRSRDRKAKY